MVFKRVDIQEAEEEIEGFSYESSYGGIEQVRLYNNGAELVEIAYEYDSDKFVIYTDDIPKLILALQAAYDHVKGKK